MPCATSSRIATRVSRRYSPTSSPAGPSTHTIRRKTLVPLCGPDGTVLPGILADSDPALKDLTKSEAQVKVNQSIREAVIKITGGAPNVRAERLCRKDHTMGVLQPMVGHNNYTEIGRYYSIVSFSLITINFPFTHQCTVLNWNNLHLQDLWRMSTRRILDASRYANTPSVQEGGTAFHCDVERSQKERKLARHHRLVTAVCRCCQEVLWTIIPRLETTYPAFNRFEGSTCPLSMSLSHP